MKILLAIDASECSAAATRAVLTQFVPAGTEVLVLHADEWPSGLPSSMAFAEGASAADCIIELRDERRRAAERLVATSAARLRDAGFSVITTVRDGDARHAICACAEDWRPDLIVVGSHGRRGLDRLLLGSVSEGVARRAPCSVEIVRCAADGAQS